MPRFHSYTGSSLTTNSQGCIRGSWLFCDNMGLHFGGLMICLVAGLSLLFAGGMFVGHEVEKHNCATAAQMYHRHAHFDDWTFNCYLQTTDGRMVKLNTYITTHEERRR